MGRSHLRSGTRSRAVREASIFTASNVLVGVLGIVSTAVLARNLTTREFGSYAFAVSFLAFVALLFDFGFFAPAARLAARSEPRAQREITGAALVLYAPIGLAYCIAMFGLSFRVDAWFHVSASHPLRIAALFAFALPLIPIVQQLAQGVDRLHIASISLVVLQALLVALLVISAGSLSPTKALVLRCLSVAGAALCAVVWLRPSFRFLRKWLTELVRETRRYGFAIYVGRILSIGTYNMDVLMLGVFTNARSVGFYTLAGSIAAAANLPVLGLSTALFAPMARARKIRRQLLVVGASLGLITALAAWALAKPFIELVFSDRYAPAAALVLPLALAQAVRGLTGFYNTFLSAQGEGRALRNAGIVLTVSNLVFNFALIPPFGAMGAAWASLFALVANLGAHVIFYRRALEDDMQRPEYELQRTHYPQHEGLDGLDPQHDRRKKLE